MAIELFNETMDNENFVNATRVAWEKTQFSLCSNRIKNVSYYSP